MDVVVQDDDSDHHPETEGHSVLAVETAAILPEKDVEIRGQEHVKSWSKQEEVESFTYGVSNMTLHTLAIVLKQSVVFSMGRFLFYRKTEAVW